MNATERPSLKELGEHIVRWRTDKGFRTDIGNIQEKLLLVISEVIEAMEEHRAGFQFAGDSHPIGKNYENFIMEVGDAEIRVLDLGYSLGFDIAERGLNVGLSNRIEAIRQKKAAEFDYSTVPMRMFEIIRTVSRLSDYIESGIDDMVESEDYMSNIGDGIVWMSDAIIRLSSDMGFDIMEQMVKKMAVNEKRPKKHGKAY